MPQVPTPPRALSVLLVEDSPVIRHRLQEMLRTAPDLRVVGSAEGPAEALAEVERLAPDLLLLDLSLRGGSGLDVLRGIAPLPSPPATVVLTAFATEEHRKRAYALGAAAVLDKQSQFDAVPASLRDAVRRHDRARALEAMPVLPNHGGACGPCLFTELVEATAELVAMEGPDALRALGGLLSKVGEASGAERGYIYVAPEGGGSYQLLDSWREAGTADLPTPLAEVPAGIFDWGEDRLKALRPVVIADPADLPADAGMEQQILVAEGVRSWLAVPLRQGKTQYGFLALDTITRRQAWPPLAVTVTQLLGQVSAAVVARHRGGARLRASESTLRALVDHAPLGIFRSDPGGRLMSVNPALARMLDYESAEALLRLGSLEELCADAAARARTFADLTRDGVVTGRELTMRRQDSTPVTVLVNARAVRTTDGRLLAFEGFVEDVTARKLLEASLRQSQRAEILGQLSGGLAHDLGNLLTVVAASATLLELELGDAPDAALRELEGLGNAITRARELVLRLMAVGHSRVFDRKPVDLAAIVVDTAKLLRRVLPENIEVVVDGAYDPMGVLADRGALEQVLMNLATNARDAMPGGGRLVFRLRSAAGAHLLEVEDTGTGIPAEIRQRVFEPFFTTKDEGRGTGLGLAMVRSIVEHCQGTVAVESEPGRGTRFVLRCPIHDAPVARPVAVGAIARRGGAERILLVEDQPEIRRVAQRLLERAGYMVEISEDGEAALTRLTDGGAPVQLVITDVVMPRLSGPELYEATRWLPRRPRFLFTSGYSQMELPDLEAGTVGFVQKPWTRDELLARVREILDRPVAELAA